jgi:hypothetical protein
MDLITINLFQPQDRSKGTSKKMQLKRDNSYATGLAQSPLSSPEEV